MDKLAWLTELCIFIPIYRHQMKSCYYIFWRLTKVYWYSYSLPLTFFHSPHPTCATWVFVRLYNICCLLHKVMYLQNHIFCKSNPTTYYNLVQSSDTVVIAQSWALVKSEGIHAEKSVSWANTRQVVWILAWQARYPQIDALHSWNITIPSTAPTFLQPLRSNY